MTETIYFASLTVSIEDRLKEVVRELKLIRSGHEMYVWENEIDVDEVEGEE